MCRGGRRPDQASLLAQGRADLRAPKRSARRRREAPKNKNQLLVHFVLSASLEDVKGC